MGVPDHGGEDVRSCGVRLLNRADGGLSGGDRGALRSFLCRRLLRVQAPGGHSEGNIQLLQGGELHLRGGDSRWVLLVRFQCRPVEARGQRRPRSGDPLDLRAHGVCHQERLALGLLIRGGQARLGERVRERSRLAHLLGPGDELHRFHLRHLLLLLHLHARLVRVAALHLRCLLLASQLLLRVEDGGGHLLHFRLERLRVCGVLRVRALPFRPLLRRRGRRALRAGPARLLMRARDWRHWRIALLDRGLGLLAFRRVASPLEHRELVARLPVACLLRAAADLLQWLVALTCGARVQLPQAGGVLHLLLVVEAGVLLVVGRVLPREVEGVALRGAAPDELRPRLLALEEVLWAKVGQRRPVGLAGVDEVISALEPALLVLLERGGVVVELVRRVVGVRHDWYDSLVG